MDAPSTHRLYLADHIWQGTVRIASNRRTAADTFCLRLVCPEIARRFVPGQFVMIRLAGTNDPLLARPLAIYDVAREAGGDPIGIDIVYLTVGKMTRRLAALPADSVVEVWGPLGNGFDAEPAEHLVMVAGGIGQTPFVALARERTGRQGYGDPPRTVERARKVSLCYGTRSKEYLAGLDDFTAAGVDVHLSTDDGSAGHRGLVVDLIQPVIRAAGMAARVICCGPEKMMAATAATCRRLGIACQVSLETPMACGLGICFSCVAKVRDGDGGWDWRRTCVEGPVFDAESVVFDE